MIRANRRLKGGDAVSLEAEVVMMGVRLALEKVWHHVVIESDYEVVINQLRGQGNRWRIEALCSNIIGMVNNGVSMEWKAVQQSINESANWITKQTRMGVCPNDWVSIPPPLVLFYLEIVIMSLTMIPFKE